MTIPETTREKPSFIQSFSLSQASSAVATGSDFGLLFLLTEHFHVWYVIATACGAFTGALVNFLLNRYWTFKAAHDEIHHQALRYALVSGGSLLLNTGGVWLLTESTHLHYSISVILVSTLVGFFFNYPLQRHFVFK
jgi:putative flippase GtrA